MSRSILVGMLAFCAALNVAAAEPQVVVSNAWVRGTVAGQTATGAFMQLRAGAGATLVGATSPVAQSVEVHEMKMDGGVMKMRAIDRLHVPAGKPVELSPGGHHLMLMGLTAPLKEGASVPVTLTFEDKAGNKSLQTVNAPVRPLTAGGTQGTRKH